VRRTWLLLASLLFLLSAPLYGNSFFRAWVGEWRAENRTTVADDYNSTFRTKYKMRIRLLANGTLYGVLEGRIGKKRVVGKIWAFRNGTARAVVYTNGKKTDESRGRWSLKNNQFTTMTRSSIYRTRGESVLRRVNRNRFVANASDSDGSRSTTIYTRIRK
jgi:hypothetical protein